jgi:ferric-dicitrate binding protein FerR (iron transport regulator)
MKSPRLAEAAARLMADSRKDAPDRPVPPLPRDRAIDAIARAIEARARLRRRRRWVMRTGAAAAIVALGVGMTAMTSRHRTPIAQSAATPTAAVLHVEGGGVDVQPGPGTTDPRAGASPLGRGSRLVARPDGRATLAFATGTQLTLEEKADVTIVSEGATQRFALTGGAVRAHVAKLGPGDRFVIATSDAEIEVRGTSFRVSVVPPDAACGDGTTTRVDVVEGTVWVKHAGGEAVVDAGETWPTGCTPPVVAPSANVVAPTPSTVKSSALAASKLAEQNDLFADGVAAKRRGANAEAIATFERFAAKYPASPLAESATIERMKLLDASGSPLAKGAATQYLARYPHGYARDDAERIARP